jgi:predicted nucleic-acid-binding Zn-ribbon protein
MQLQVADIPSLTYAELSEQLRLARVNPGHYANLIEPLQQELAKRSPTANYRCVKCAHDKYQRSEIRTARSFLSSFFNVQSAKYSAVVCKRCSFTEFYQGRVSPGQQALDFVFGS